MSNESWKAIWNGKSSEPPESPAAEHEAIVAELLRLDGYHTPTATVAAVTWIAHVQRLARARRLTAGERLFEVGCGAGAFLWPLAQMGVVTDGIDYSASLVEVARRHFRTARIQVGEAADIDTSERYDVVVSNGVFPYFADAEYARTVTSKMLDKCLREVWILDVNDAARKDEALAIRRASYPPGEYDRRYAGLEQLYLEQEWFRDIARTRGLDCTIESQPLHDYVSALYRFNVYFARR